MTRPGASIPDLAWATGADEADIRYLISDHLGIELDDDLVPYDLIGEIHDVLDPHSERSVPGWYGYIGEDV